MSCYVLATRFYNDVFFSYQILYIMRLHSSIASPVFLVRKSLLGLALLVVFWIQFFLVTSNQESGPLVIRKMQVDRGVLKGFPSQSFVDYTP